MKRKEKMLVKVEINYGRKWNGSCYEQTPGRGVQVNVSEHMRNRREGFSFRGCPLGRTSGEEAFTVEQAIDYAIRDFIGYGKHEYLGKRPLTHDMIEVAETVDYRTSEAVANGVG